MKLAKTLSLAVLLLVTALSSPLKACGDYCDYSGMYGVGGYNLYSFSVDIYAVYDYGYSNYDYSGGSCGSFSGCGSCYDIGLLSGYSGLNTYYDTSLLNWPVYSPSFPYPTSTFPGMFPGVNPYWPPITQYPFIPPSYPAPTWPIPMDPTWPTIPTFPPTTGFPPIAPPPTTNPPYGGCDNIIIMCPGGSMLRPPGVTTFPTPTVPTFPSPATPSFPTPTAPSFPTTPNAPSIPTTQPMPQAPVVFDPTTTHTNTDPVRIQVPRGVKTR